MHDTANTSTQKFTKPPFIAKQISPSPGLAFYVEQKASTPKRTQTSPTHLPLSKRPLKKRAANLGQPPNFTSKRRDSYPHLPSGFRNLKVASQARLPLSFQQLRENDLSSRRPILQGVLDVDDDDLDALKGHR